jgi:hypothetical protein
VTDVLEQDLRAALAERAACMPDASDAIGRLRHVDYRSRHAPSRRRRRPAWLPLWPALGGATAALGAGIATAIVLLSSGAAPALAGWTPVPTTPTPAALAKVTKACRWASGPLLRRAMTGKLVLVDQRGRFIAELYTAGIYAGVCISGGRRDDTGGGGDTVVLHFYAAPGPDQLGMPDNGGGGTLGFDSSNPHQYGLVRHAFGLAGKNVRAVSFRFAGGSVVKATVEHGWYFAWWPNMNYPTSVRVRTTSGTIRSPMMPTGGQGRGCRFGARRCVWSGFRPHAAPPVTALP